MYQEDEEIAPAAVYVPINKVGLTAAKLYDQRKLECIGISWDITYGLCVVTMAYFPALLYSEKGPAHPGKHKFLIHAYNPKMATTTS